MMRSGLKQAPDARTPIRQRLAAHARRLRRWTRGPAGHVGGACCLEKRPRGVSASPGPFCSQPGLGGWKAESPHKTPAGEVGS